MLLGFSLVAQPPGRYLHSMEVPFLVFLERRKQSKTAPISTAPSTDPRTAPTIVGVFDLDVDEDNAAADARVVGAPFRPTVNRGISATTEPVLIISQH